MNVKMSGSDGSERMKALMSSIRQTPPTEIAGERVTTVRDYLGGTITDVESGKVEQTGLPSSNVLYFTTESCVLVIRPSGTEPKVKLYFMARGGSSEEAKARIEAIKVTAQSLL